MTNIDSISISSAIDARLKTEQINAGSNFINKETINEAVCSCIYKTRSNHCDAFKYFNTIIPDYSIYEIGRISAKKVGLLVDNEQLAIIDMPPNFELNVNQQTQVASVKQEQPIHIRMLLKTMR